jgi:hypothetical protein
MPKSMRRRRVGTRRRRRTRKPLTGGAIHNRNTRHTRPLSPITTKPVTATATKPSTTTAPVHVKTNRMDELSPSEMNQIDGLIKESFTMSSISQLDKNNICLFAILGGSGGTKNIVSALFLKPVCIGPGGFDPTAVAEHTSKCMYVHTVCVSSAYRGMGLLHKMLFALGKISHFKDTVFKLEAANTTDHGLNQDARFQIYSKSGFTLPIGTVIEPHRYHVTNVEMTNSSGSSGGKSITYTVKNLLHNGRIEKVSYSDIHPEACSIHNTKQERGCVMESNSKRLREFNSR